MKQLQCKEVQKWTEKPKNACVEDKWLAIKMTRYRTKTASQPGHKHQDVASTRITGVPATTSQVSQVSLKIIFWPQY